MSESRTTAGTFRQSMIPVRTAGLAAGLGAWILWSGVFLTGSGPIIWSNFLAGAAIAVFASYAAAWPDGGRLPAIAAPAIALLLGIWVLAAPFVLEVTAARLFWSNVVSGALVALLAAATIVGTLRSTQSGSRTRT